MKKDKLFHPVGDGISIITCEPRPLWPGLQPGGGVLSPVDCPKLPSALSSFSLTEPGEGGTRENYEASLRAVFEGELLWWEGEN